MPLFRSSPFEELIALATSEHNVSEDWSAIMDICDKAVNYEDGQKFCLQAITKRLYHKVPRVVMQTLVLLDACVQNCGKKFHLEVSSRYFVTEIQKLLSKMHASTADKLKQLVRKWAENDFKNDPELGLIPSLYYKLKSEGVDFPAEQETKPAAVPISTDPNVVSSQQEEEDIIKAIALSLNGDQSSPVRDDTTDSSSSSSVATSEPLKVRALYDFEAVEDNELTIKAGEIVLIIDRSNNSWWRGSNHRGEGYLPANFVTENLDEKADLQEVAVDEEETLPKQVDDSIDDVVGIDEGKIQNALDWLNDIDPTSEIEDPDDLLVLERQSYAMAPFIEEKLQHIDKKCTLLNSLNEELMDAVQLFYTLNSLGSGALNSSAFLDHIHTPDAQAHTISRQHGYVAPRYIKTVDKTASTSGVPSQSSFIAVKAQPAPENVSRIHFPSPSQPSFPSYCYQPVYAMFSPELDSGYPVMVSNIPEQQSVHPTGVAANTKNVPQETTNSASSSNTTSSVTDVNSSIYNTSAVPNTGTMPVVYQPVVLQSPFTSPNAVPSGLAYSTYHSNVPIQQPGTGMLPQAVNTYMPHYIAQVVLPSGSSLNSQEMPPSTTQLTAAELSTNSLNQGSADSVHRMPALQAASEEIHPPVTSSTPVSSTVSNPECGMTSSM